jgi:Ni/Co efflux regulator RcnB
MGRPHQFPRNYDRWEEWQKHNDFEQSEHRKGYRAGRDRVSKGKPIPDLSDRTPEYQKGYISIQAKNDRGTAIAQQLVQYNLPTRWGNQLNGNHQVNQ